MYSNIEQLTTYFHYSTIVLRGIGRPIPLPLIEFVWNQAELFQLLYKFKAYYVDYPPPPTNNNEFTYTAVEKRDRPIVGIDNPHKRSTHITLLTNQ